MPDLAVYLVIGVIAGVLAGLLGIGGGLLIVPSLVWVFERDAFPDSVIMQMALGTSLATIIVTSISSLRAHSRKGNVDWAAFWRLTPGVLLGAPAGSVISHYLPGDALRTIFGAALLLISLQMLFAVGVSPRRQLPGTAGLFGAGLLIGIASAIIGIGGGSLTVPYLVWNNLQSRYAVGTSAACGLPIALSGAAGFVINGQFAQGLPEGSLGYVFLPAFFGVAAASALLAPVGASLASRLRSRTLSRVFALFLAAMALRFLLR
ncbi:MAG: sulfite exporter TauE/SafE family protein [Bryobacterales bacterium]|nr:sulfite exporter TauE/SafE family protein [Bryobacterales bacterium]